jgi:hypothetical protein
MKTIYIYPMIDCASTGENKEMEYFIDYVMSTPDGKLKAYQSVFTDKKKAQECYNSIQKLARIS